MMKRWEIAKNAGLNWQVVLIEDLQTDIKLVIRDDVLADRSFNQTHKHVTELIQTAVRELESKELKALVQRSFPLFASKVYVKTVTLFGTRTTALFLLTYASSRGERLPPKLQTQLETRTQIKPINRPIKDVPAIYNRAVPNEVYNKEYEREVIQRMKDLATMPAKEDYSEYSSVRASAERQVRWEWHEKQLADLQDKGVDLVWIDSHANCSARCQPWQGKLYSISGKSGEIDGVKYQPLSNATDIYYTTKTGKTWKNGCISGFGCRHRLIEYKQGFRPETIPADVVEKERTIDKTQRGMERKIRSYEAKALYYKGTIPKLYKHYRSLAKTATNEYIDYSHKNNVAYYPSRIDI